MRNRWIVFGALALGVMVAGCSDSLATSGEGTVSVQLTDAPFPLDDVESVDIFVVRVDAKMQQTTEAEAGEGVDGEASNGWLTVAEPDASFNLLSLQNGTSAALGANTIPAGTYHSFRLVIDPSQSSITLKDGTVLSGDDISFPSADRSGLKVILQSPLTVIADAETIALVDFDVGQSFVMRGATIEGGLNFKPVIKATISPAS